jgi:hypothetical protein
MRAWISPRRREKLTESRARTPGKDLVMARARRRDSSEDGGGDVMLSEAKHLASYARAILFGRMARALEARSFAALRMTVTWSG